MQAKSPLHHLRGYQKKLIFKRIDEVIATQGVRDKRLIFAALRDKYFDEGGIPERLVTPYYFAISTTLHKLR